MGAPEPDKLKNSTEPEEKSHVTGGGVAVYGDKIAGDKVLGDKVAGNKITQNTYNYYLEGTHFYLPEFTTTLKNFLYNYLGDENNPVPFGGRNDALQKLETWRLQENAPPRLLLTAPAGRGKSALLVRWSAALQTEQDWAVIFMPISIRFGTNEEKDTFSLLATRLAKLYGKEIPENWGNFPGSRWRALVAEYLQEPLPDGRNLLLILDGLDEAAWQPGADLFPLQLPNRVRLVISARYKGGEAPGPQPWLRQLGWDRFPNMAATMELETLTQDGVRDVLEKMDAPLDALGRNIDIVAELYRLSQGDPLLVELYVKDLWQQGEAATRLKLEDLAHIKPGYAGFFDKWWQDQEKLWGHYNPLDKALVQDLLEVLAVALGPLTSDELRRLIPGRVRSRELNQAVAPLNRFVIGDGHEQGYAFAHPKLGEYFRDEMGPDEQVSWQERFHTWGKETIAQLRAEQLKPTDAPRYLMFHYGRHLEDSQAGIEDLLELVSWEWIQLWHEKTGTYTGFLQDTDRVWKRLNKENDEAVKQEQAAPYIGQEILCALSNASVNSLADNIPDDLLALLLKNKIWTEEQAVAYVRQRNDIFRRLGGFEALTSELSIKSRAAVWADMLAAALKITDEGNRARVLSAIAPHLSQEQQQVVLQGALATARQINDEKERASLLSAIALHLPQEQQQVVLQGALAAARQINDEKERASLLSVIAPHLPQEQQQVVLQGALATARQIDSEWNRARVLSAIAPYLPQETLVAARQITDEWSRADVLSAIAPHLPQEQQQVILTETLAVAYQNDIGLFQVPVLCAIAPYLPQETLTITRELDNELSQATVLSAIAPHLPQEQQQVVLQKALAVARHIDDKWSRSDALNTIVPHLSQDQQPEVLQEALAAARHLDDEWFRAVVLNATAPHLPQETLAAARQINSEVKRAHVLIAIAPHLPQDQQQVILQEALTAARQIDNERIRARVLSAIAPHLPQETLANTHQITNEGRRADVLIAIAPHLPQETLAAARQITDESRRATVLSAIAPHLPQNQQRDLLTEALAAARQMHNESRRATVLSAIAPYLPKDQQQIVLEEALTAARQIDDERRRARVLGDITPHLPQETLAAACQLTDEWSRADVLSAIAPHLPQEILAASYQLDDKGKQAFVLTAIAPHLPQEQMQDVLIEAFAAARQIDEELRRAYVLSVIVHHLPQDQLQDVLTESFAAAHQIDEENSRAVLLSEVSNQLISLPVNKVSQVWRETLAILSRRTRTNLFHDLAALMPVIHKLGGEKAVRDTLDAVQKVTKWWP